MGFRDKFKNIFDSGNDDSKSSDGAGFASLARMISSGNDVVLDTDITLSEKEVDKYLEGIELTDGIVIDGQGHAIDACQKARVFKITGSGVVLKNITFKNGVGYEAGAIYVDNFAGAEITDCTFKDNNTVTKGAAIVNYSEIVLRGVEFADNYAGDMGGAVYNEMVGNATFISCSFKDNASKKGGGALYNNGKATLEDVDFSENVSEKGNGGALSNQKGAEVSLVNCSFKDNSSHSGGGAVINFGKAVIEGVDFSTNASNEGEGGGINNQKGNVSLKDCSFKDNSSKSGGGALINFSKITLDDVNFEGNISKESGGGGFSNHNDGDASFSGCFFKDNSSKTSGGALINRGKAVLNGVDFSTNASNEGGGGALINFSKITLDGVNFEGNVSKESGGGGFNNQDDGDASFSGCSFKDNSSKTGGGALINFGKAVLNGVDFSTNASNEGWGGGFNNQDDGDASLSGCSFKDNSSKSGGGALVNYSKITLDRVNFEGNVSKEGEGGGLNNQTDGDASLSGCSFKDNSSKGSGGALINLGKITLDESVFSSNATDEGHGGAMFNRGEMHVSNSDFKDNNAHHGGAIHNQIDGGLTVSASCFKDNVSKGDGGAINNNAESSKLNASECRFISNKASAGGGAVVNWGNVSIRDSEFKDNFSQTDGNDINFQTGSLNLSNVRFNNTKDESIFSVDDSLVEIEGCEFTGLDDDEILKGAGERNFRYLDVLVKSGENVIVLDSDIIIGQGEENRYAKGIKLESDDLTIDGNGHSIDAGGLTRIFIVKGNVTLKNMTLKNGHSKDAYGGAIYHRDNSSLTIENVTFADTTSDIEGGAIVNLGDVTVKNSNFNRCHSGNRGGAIFNNDEGTLTLEQTKFIENTSDETGGAIHNFGNVSVEGGEFHSNESQENGGAIINFSEISLRDVLFNENSSRNGEGGAVNNQGNSSITCAGCSFKGNATQKYGGAVMNFGKLAFEDCEFEGNDSSNGGAIYNADEAELMLSNSRFTKNSCSLSGAAVRIDEESSSFSADGCTFEENIAGYNGAAMFIWADSFVSNCRFADNFAKQDGNDISIHKGTCELSNLIFNDVRDTSIYCGTDAIMNLKDCSFGEDSGNGFDSNAKGNDFRHLESLIKSGESPIVLESGISLMKGEEHMFEDGIKIAADGLVIDGAGHSIDAGGLTRIFTIEGEGISLKNITFRNASADSGSAILCTKLSTLEITGCRFEDNSSTSSGGAIQNLGNVLVEESVFEGNASKEGGGAIFNEADAKLTVSNTDFIRNSTEGEGGAINNNRTSSALEVSGCRFDENSSKSDGGALINWGNATVSDSKFSSNASQRQGNDIDAESGMLRLSGVMFESTQDEAIFSMGDDLLRIEDCEFVQSDDDETQAFDDSGERNFTYLDSLAKSGMKSIILDSDITAEGSEGVTYRDGIELEAEGLVIDGAGHTIDAGGMARIFHVLAEGVTLKNITFANGSNDVGAAVYVAESATLNISGCTFTDNAAESAGGAIFNNGNTVLEDVDFNKNSANEESGGAVNNQDGEMTFSRCVFRKNSSAEDGGAIFNWGEITLDDVKFERNSASADGGAINNQTGGKIIANSCSFRENTAEEGGAIYLVMEDDVELTDCSFRGNEPDDKCSMI